MRILSFGYKNPAGEKPLKKFVCEICDFYSNNKKDYKRHCATNKHMKKAQILSSIGKNKLFYDVIYNPNETNFLKTGKKLGNKTENGKLMFIYQALASFKVWHGVEPKINEELIKILD